MRKSVIFLASKKTMENLGNFLQTLDNQFEIVNVQTLGQLDEMLSSEKWDILLSFGTSLIIPKRILEQSNLTSINIHPGSPDYPGRDPHHFAVYDRVSQYGATMHFMSEYVDEGEIIDVELFDVKIEDLPVDLLKRSAASGIKLFEKLFLTYLGGSSPQANLDYSWGGRTHTRADFLELCKIDSNITKDELIRRCRACHMPGYKNLYTEIQGHRFFLETT